MTPSNYLVWGFGDVEGACLLGHLSNVPDDHLLLSGSPIAANFPDDAFFPMHPDFPDDIMLIDSLANTDSVKVVSKRLADFLQEHVGRFVEFLPVGIVSHEQERSEEPYFIVHPVEPIDCLDLARCGGTRSKLVPTAMLSIDRLVLDETKVDPARSLFRPAGYAPVTLVARQLADALDRGSFSGIRWIEPSDYPEI